MSDKNEPRRRALSESAWENVLAAAAHAQRIVPDAVLVGGTAAALYAEHRFSYDDDHVVAGLVDRFAEVLADLESVAGWTTARIRPPVLILGNFNGVDTGIRNLRRTEPLCVEVRDTPYGAITLPTLDEMLRIKAWLVVSRNAVRDTLDFVALATTCEEAGGADAVSKALASVDRLYPQSNGSSVRLQLARQLADPRPYDIDEVDLGAYLGIADRWRSWDAVVVAAAAYARAVLADYAEPE